MTLKDPTYYNVNGKLQPTTWDQVFAATEKIRAFFDKLNEFFPGRSDLIIKIMYAMMSRHHVLLMGPHGTAKTQIFNTVLDNIQGAAIWRDQMTKETKPEDLFGPYNVKVWRETGIPERITEGTLSTANFALIGEFFDANDMTLRATLGALHERIVRLGLQVVRPPILTVLADTNFHLEDEPDRVRTLAALVDRFLFQVDIDYLTDPKDRIRMFTNANSGLYVTSPGTLQMVDLELVSGLVHAENLITDEYVVSAFEEATRGFREGQRGRNEILISDRRMVQASIVMEVHALLRGNQAVDFEDVDEARLVICGRPPEHGEFFDKKVPHIVGDWIKKAGNQALEAERLKIATFVNAIPELDIDQALDEKVLVDHVESIVAVQRKLKKHVPKHAVLSAELIGHITAVEQRLEKAQLRLLAVLARGIPEAAQIQDANGQANQLDTLRIMIVTLKDVRTKIVDIKAISDQVRSVQRETLERSTRVLTDMITASGFTLDT